MIRAIFFDIDDTLYDSTRLTTMARLNSIRAMIDAGLDYDEKFLYERLYEIIKKFGPNYPRHYNELLKSLGLKEDPKLIASGVVAYEHTKFAYLKPFPRVVPTLLKLKDRYKLGVISNGIAIKQWEKLINLGLHHYFDVVITSEEVGYEKPSKEIFLEALKSLNVKPEESIMVGDNPSTDILGAKSVGMITIRIRKGKRAKIEPKNELERADFDVENFDEIPKIIDIIEKKHKNTI